MEAKEARLHYFHAAMLFGRLEFVTHVRLLQVINAQQDRALHNARGDDGLA